MKGPWVILSPYFITEDTNENWSNLIQPKMFYVSINKKVVKKCLKDNIILYKYFSLLCINVYVYY